MIRILSLILTMKMNRSKINMVLIIPTLKKNREWQMECFMTIFIAASWIGPCANKPANLSQMPKPAKNATIGIRGGLKSGKTMPNDWTHRSWLPNSARATTRQHAPARSSKWFTNVRGRTVLDGLTGSLSNTRTIQQWVTKASKAFITLMEDFSKEKSRQFLVLISWKYLAF